MSFGSRGKATSGSVAVTHRLDGPSPTVNQRDPTGIPYLAPEIVLLFKAKHADRDKDAADFARALPLLDDQRRQWLADALRVVHPGHDWITLVVNL